MVSAAVTLQMEGAICRDARIVLGGVAPIPWDRPRAAEVLRGKRLSPEVAAEAARIAVEDARPMTKNAYKVALTSALIRRTLVSLAENGNG